MSPLRLVVYAVAIVAILAHPLVDAGSDEDEAIEIGWAQILAGESPWAAKTHLDNPLTPTYGALLLCLPGLLAAQWLGLVGVLILDRGNIAWALVCLLSLKTLAQGIDYLYCSAVFCLALRWLTGPASGRCGPSSCASSDGDAA